MSPTVLYSRSAVLDQCTSSQHVMPTLLTKQLSNITEGNLSDYMQLPLK